MRGLSTLLLLTCLISAGCTNEDPVPAFIALEYQLRCIGECSGSPDAPTRLISNVDDEDELTLTCAVEESGSARLLSFRAFCPGKEGSDDPSPGCGDDKYNFEIRKIDLGSSSEVTDPGGSCEVFIEEEGNRYRGDCTGGDADPADDKPCQVKLSINGSFVEGTVHCVEIPGEGTVLTRHVVAPFSQDPATFTLEGCQGL